MMHPNNCKSRTRTCHSNAAAKVTTNKMPVTLYHLIPSPPCRAVRLVARVIGLDLNLKLVDMTAGDNKTPEYMKLNPTSSMPTMEDNGFVIWESRAILSYLVNAYAKDDSLYPRDPQQRASVDQRLYFDIGTFYPKYLKYYVNFIFGSDPLNPESGKEFDKGMEMLNSFLEGHNFIAGNHMTIADISLIPTIANVDAFGYDLSPYRNTRSWYSRMKKELTPFGYEEINQTGADIFGQMFRDRTG